MYDFRFYRTDKYYLIAFLLQTEKKRTFNRLHLIVNMFYNIQIKGFLSNRFV